MAFMNILTTGLGFLGGIGGLIAGNNAEAQAQKAEENAIRGLTTAQDQEYLNTEGAGLEGLSGLSGKLNAALGTGARALGSAEAGAGVYNSSAVAGAVANQAASNASAESSYSSNLANTLATIKARNDQQAAQMQYGFAANNLNYARQQAAGGVNGMSSAIQSLGRIKFRTAGGPNPNVAGNGNMDQGGFPSPQQVDPSGGAPGVNPYGGYPVA